MHYDKMSIAMICDENFVMQTGVALTSLAANKNSNTVYDIYIVTVDCSTSSVQFLQGLEKDDLLIHIINASVEQYQNIKQLAHVPLACLYKFNLCDMIPQYDKLLYLDGDTIIREDLWELYSTDLQSNYVAGVAHSLGIVTGEIKINGGVLLFNAQKIREEGLKDVFVKTRQELGNRKSMDQETFHIVFGDKKVLLPPKYNVMMDKVDYEKKYYSMKEYNQFYGTKYCSRKEIVETSAIMHFTGEVKPWKYKFAKGFSEWYLYYGKILGKSQNLVLKGRISFLREQIKANGIICLYWIIKDKLLAVLGEYFGIFLDKSHGEWN